VIPPEFVRTEREPVPETPLNYSYRFPVFATTVVVAVLLILAAYFTDRNGGVDEIGLFNPPYMALHFGKMTYPVHGYFNNMVVHPPVHYEMIALAMRAGLNSYYAEATPTLLMLLLAVALIAVGPFPGPVKIGLLYGLWVSMAIFGRAGIELFGMRPEGDIEASWMAGLVALESGRLEKWNLPKLFLGALLITYAASLHYYAVAGLAGVGIYMMWAYRDLGLAEARKPLLAMAAGGLLLGIPYLLLFVIPHRDAIYEMVAGTRTGGSVKGILEEHFNAYKAWGSGNLGNFLLTVPFWTMVPATLISTPILWSIRSTRGIALAALPLELFLLLFAWHKLPPYYIHEFGLYTAAVVAGALFLADRLLPRLPGRWMPYAAWPGIALLLGIGWWQLGKWQPLFRRSDLLTISTQPRVHEMEIARAAGMEMLGPNARVASRIGGWYASGASYLHDPSGDVVEPVTLPEGFVPYYFSQFDAVAENPHMSNANGGNDLHMTLLSWYLNGTLKLRGLFFAGHNDGLNYWLFTAKQPASVAAFGLERDQLSRFTEDPAGGDEMVTWVSPDSPELNRFCAQFHFYSIMYLPKARPDEVQQMIVAGLMRSGSVKLEEAMPPGSKIVQRIHGVLQKADLRVLLDKMKQVDRPIHFYARYENMPGVVPFPKPAKTP